MPDLSSLLQQLPIQQIAQQVGADEPQTRSAVEALVPALIGGLDANAQDPAGAASIANALGQHDGSLLDSGNLGGLDLADGAKIVSHIFGGQTDTVMSRLGGTTGDSGLVSKLMPILAPLVMAWLSKQVTQRAGGTASAQAQSPDLLTSILGSVLGGGRTTTQAAPAAPTGGSIVTDLLGGLLGAGRR